MSLAGQNVYTTNRPVYTSQETHTVHTCRDQHIIMSFLTGTQHTTRARAHTHSMAAPHSLSLSHYRPGSFETPVLRVISFCVQGDTIASVGLMKNCLGSERSREGCILVVMNPHQPLTLQLNPCPCLGEGGGEKKSYTAELRAREVTESA